MSKNFWIVSRPKRKLIIVPEMLKVFAAVTIGKTWTGNRELQKNFERELVRFEWKAQNLSKDGSGSRTYAALLGLLGLWYEDEKGVQLTQAGKEIVSGEAAVPQLTKQLVNFQYPSPYSKSVHIDESYKIHPHRFVINLLSHASVNGISQDELAFCVVPVAKTNSDIEVCVEKLQQFQIYPELVIAEALAQSKTTESNLRNVANTIINQLEYTGFFKYRDEPNAPLEFDLDGKGKATLFIEKYGRALSSDFSDKSMFLRRYGSGINITKDYSDTNPVQPTTSPNDRLVLIKFYEIANTRPVFGISEELITEISQDTGISPKQVKPVLSKIANQPLWDSFEERYINLSKGGNETATEFEKVTTNVFSKEGFGLDAEWVGSRGVYPDIFVYIDKSKKIHGIVDTKAYKKYTLDIDQRNKMAHSYIPAFKNITYKGEEYTLGFYAYIAGGYGTNIQTNFEKLRVSAGATNGCYITAHDFMQLLRRHRATGFSPAELLQIFTLNKQVIYDEVAG